MGLIIYTDKKLTNPEEFEKKKIELDNIYDDSRKAILRLLVKIKSPFIIKVYD